MSVITAVQIFSLCMLALQNEPPVSVHSHAAQWIEVEGKVVFRFEATVKNTLDIGLQGVDVGVVYASDSRSLESVEPAELYSDDSTLQITPKTIALRLPISTAVAPKSSTRIRWEIPSSPSLQNSSVKPRAFLSHLLGYRFASSPLSIVDKLLEGDTAAAEWSLVESLGLTPAGRTLLVARENLNEQSIDFDKLCKLFEAELPRAPAQAVVVQWVARILILGVIGGDVARQWLTKLKARADLPHLDEGFQVFRVARLTKNIYESPLAFAFPAKLATVEELLVHALSMAEDTFSAPVEKLSDVEGAPDLGLTKQAPRRDSMEGVGTGLIIGFCIGVLGVLFWNSRKRRNEQSTS